MYVDSHLGLLLYRLEKVNITRRRSQAKILGTIVTVGGAMFMTLVKGPLLNLPWTDGHAHQGSTSAANKQNPLLGAGMILVGCVCWSGFMILQVRVPIIIDINLHRNSR